METTALDYSVLSKRRNDLFGIAIVSIVIFHFCLLSKWAAAKIYIALVGSVGVPVFLMLSGMGLFFSMSKNASIGQFYKKRLVRVVIPYAIVAGVHFLVRYILIDGKGFIEWLRGVFFVDFITKGNSQFWFIAFILVMYLLFPLFFKLFQSGKLNFLKLVVLCGAVAAANFALSRLAPELYDNIEVMLTRIPAFLIGVYLGEKVYNKRAVQLPFWLISILGSAAFIYVGIMRNVAGVKFSMYIVRYGETIYALLFIMVLAIVLEAVNSGAFSKICAFFGGMSLELYMVHVSLRNIMGKIGFPGSNILYYAVMVVIAIGISFALQKFDAFAAKKLTAPKAAKAKT
ncbi:MAG: acyltransferase [Clostridia bacterium]|nr:acyltransferase [Clostridia bacterium]